MKDSLANFAKLKYRENLNPKRIQTLKVVDLSADTADTLTQQLYREEKEKENKQEKEKNEENKEEIREQSVGLKCHKCEEVGPIAVTEVEAAPRTTTSTTR